MTSSRFMRIVLVAASVLIIVGVSLLAVIMTTSDDRNHINVSVGDGKSETIEFDNLGLVPGEQCEYRITLKGENARKYDLSLDFSESEENEKKTLKNYARVRVISGEEIICDELLADAFEMDAVILPVDFTQNKNTDIFIVYYLPIDIGNEAKNAEAIFDLVLTASNE